MEKAKLRSGQEIDGTTDKPSLNLPGAQDIIEMKEETWSSIILGWLRSAILFVLLTFLLLGVVYTVLAGTIIFAASPSSSGTVLVARGTFVGAAATPNSQIYISETTRNKDDFLNNIKVGFLGAPDPSIVTVESSQYDKVQIRNNSVVVNGKEISGKFVDKTSPSKKPVTKTVQLNKEYLVSCKIGDCKAGTLYIIEQAQIYGEVKKLAK